MRTTLDILDPLLVSAPNGGGLLYAYRQVLMPLHDEDATGLSVTADSLLWCTQGDGSRSLRGLKDGRLLSIPLAQTPLDLHDVLRTPDGLHLALTETNEVARLDDDFRIQQRWRLGGEPDSVHVNSIAWHGGRLIASMFGVFDTHRGYKGQTRKAGRVVDVHDGEVLIEGLSQPHSLVPVDGQLWLCSSEDCAVHIYDENFLLERELTLPGYTRGLAVGANGVYVGISRSRNLNSGDTDALSSASIIVLDRDSLEMTGQVPVPWNEIYDIRIVPADFPVAEAMAALWKFERGEKERARLDRERELSRTENKVAETLAAWQSEKDVRVSAEAQMQAQAEAASETRAAWQAEKEVRIVAEHQMQVQAAAASEALAAWQAEKETRMSAEQQTEEARRLLLDARGELVKHEARIAALEQVLEHTQAEIGRMKSSRSWRWTRPMRSISNVMRSAGHPDGTAPESSADHRIAGTPATSDVSRIKLQPAAGGKRDYFVWAVIDWHFRTQRPQHLARELAADGNRAFYISNNFIDDPLPGFSVEPLDADGRLFQIHLNVRGKPAIYHAAPDEPTAEQLRASMRELLAWTHSSRCVSLVQHPFWIEATSVLPNHRLAYDCMDHHGGFADNTQGVLAREEELINSADLLVVTSDWLRDEAGQHNPNCLMVRNACQYEHFSNRPSQVFKDPHGRNVIGYYGAIAEWFDFDLVEAVALRFPTHLVLLVGEDTAGGQSKLQHLDNVQFVGEVSYATLPFYLYAFDVCLLPFKIIPLTLATNPVKVYEYLSAGRNVVSVDLPEMHQFGDLIRTADSTESFCDAVATALAAKPDPEMLARRQGFAATQTWSRRVADLSAGIDALKRPRVSVVVVTYNNLEYTRACLSSLELYSDYANMEVIVVDNASSDDTPAYLEEWRLGGADRQVILNTDNRGFAAANNQGLELADGEYLVMLNNDAYVTPGWIATLVSHMRRNPVLGMLGPVTNNIGNEARIEINYADMEAMLGAAGEYTRRHAGQLTPLHTAAFFCVMMPRRVYEKIGALDEAFGIGMFEDDDYCRRVQQAGWTIACADDVFIHHNLSASFNKIKHEKRQAMFEQNKAIYEAKWGSWVPHKYRGQ